MAIRYDGSLQIRAKAGDSRRILAAALEAVCIRRFGTLRSKRLDSLQEPRTWSRTRC